MRDVPRNVHSTLQMCPAAWRSAPIGQAAPLGSAAGRDQPAQRGRQADERTPAFVPVKRATQLDAAEAQGWFLPINDDPNADKPSRSSPAKS